MSKLLVTGKRKLEGNIKISGAKNAVLPQMAASLLTNEKVTLTNVPDITDVRDMKLTLEAYGVSVKWDKSKSTLELQAERPTFNLPTTNESNIRSIRASFLVFGPLLARGGNAEVYKPTGCDIEKGGRKVDFHIQAMEKMGAKMIRETGDFVKMKTYDGSLQPGEITFKKSSVGTTETAMMAASLVKGKTVIRHAAIEPEIYDLKEMLVKMGATINIEKDTTITEAITPFGIEEDIQVWNVITIQGLNSLGGVTHQIMPDRIEFGTYAIAAAMTNGKITLEIEEKWEDVMLESIRQPLEQAGVKIDKKTDHRDQYQGVEISLENGIISPVDVETGPYPNFPTDMLPQWVVFMAMATSTSSRSKRSAIIRDKIYNNRLKYVNYVKAIMGASIELQQDDKECCVYADTTGSPPPQSGKKEVQAEDLRGGAALVLAALSSPGSTVVKQFDKIQRGYEDMIGKLKKCNADLVLLSDSRPGFHGGAGPSDIH